MAERTLLSAISASVTFICLSAAFGCLWTTAASADTITSGTYTGIPGNSVTDGGPAGPGGAGDSFESGDNTVSGGTFTGGAGGDSSGGSSSSNNAGGSGGDGVLVEAAGTTLEITGGSFAGGNGGNASGGSVDSGGLGGDGLNVYNEGAATVSGGSFTGGTGGSPDAHVGYSFSAYASGVITLVGTFEDAPSSPITDSIGTITGQLADNDSIETYSYDTDSGGTIILEAVPEPASLGLMSLGAVSLLRRRRRA